MDPTLMTSRNRVMRLGTHVLAKAENLFRTDSVAWSVYNARINLLRGASSVEVPAFTRNFFEEYCRHLRIDATIKPTYAISHQCTVVQNSVAIGYSGGAESTYLAKTYPSAHFVELMFPNVQGISRKHKREFLIALAGYVLRYPVMIVGINEYEEQENDIFKFEYSDTFVTLWNNTFPSKIAYPIKKLSKLQVYDSLSESEVRSLSVCDHNGCLSCWKCLEYAIITRYLYGTPAYKVTRIALDLLRSCAPLRDEQLPDHRGIMKVLRDTNQIYLIDTPEKLNDRA